MKEHEEIQILVQALDANLKIIDRCLTSDIKEKNIIMLSVITELRKLCDKVIPPLEESIGM